MARKYRGLKGVNKMKYRKKPVVIDCVLFKDDSEEVIEELQGIGLDPV